MIPNLTRYVASFTYRRKDGSIQSEYNRDIVAWNDKGEPLVVSTYSLQTAEDYAASHDDPKSGNYLEFECITDPKAFEEDEVTEMVRERHNDGNDNTPVSKEG